MLLAYVLLCITNNTETANDASWSYKALAGVGCEPPGVAVGVGHAGGAFLVGFVRGFRDGSRAGFERAFIRRVHVFYIDIDRGARAAGMRRVAGFDHDHRVADSGFDMKTVTDR